MNNIEIKDMPLEVRQIIGIRTKEYYEKHPQSKGATRDYKTNTYVSECFDWEETPEHHDLWSNVHIGNYDMFYKFYPDLRRVQENNIVNDYQVY